MSTEQSLADFYVTGGTMSPDADSYVTRVADEELWRAVERGEYCYVLTTRQMGKSSLMARTARQLASASVRSAQITLETIRESGRTPSADEFLYSIANRIHKDLGIAERLADWWRERALLSATQRFHQYLTELLLDSCDSRIVVFIDEIDSTIGLPFADDFYATIRACYNGRASNSELKRLTFVLLGVATPAQLIADPTRTPFNIGHGIELNDFTAEQAEPLTGGFLGYDAEKRALLDRVLYWTGGHPYLTQTLCRALAVRMSGHRHGPSSNHQLVDAEVERLFLKPEAAREEANLKFVRSRLTQGTTNLREVLRTYQRVLKGVVVEDKPASSIHASLKLAGVVRADSERRLRVRNEIYARVFGPGWVRREMPRNRGRIAALSTAAVLVSFVLVINSYRENQRAYAELENLFYEIKALDVDIANAEIQLSVSGNPEAQARLKTSVAQRRQMELNYDRRLASFNVYSRRLTEPERLILRVTRMFGESEIAAPPGYIDEVSTYIRRWQSSGRFARGVMLAEEKGYTRRIAQEFIAQNLPPQFFYLALQESDFNAFASGPPTYMGIAKGMWQFVPDTAKRYGLMIGPLATVPQADAGDDRHKWDKATTAAARYIKDIYATDAQASGLLVMAGYSWGEQRVIRLVRSMPAIPRQRNFWVLLDKYRERIPAETHDYVFSIVAAAVIGENPRLFGFNFDNPLALAAR